MRKVYLLAVSTAILASAFTACTESEEITGAEQQKSLDFSVFANKNTRAAETSTTLKTDGKKFGVWGYSTYNSGTPATVFNNQDVTYSLADNAWNYSPLKFWDKSSSYVFYAYYPYDAANVEISAGMISIKNFTVAPTVAAHVDLMIANKIDRTAGSTANVQFNFNHILSNINLKFKKGANLSIEDTKIILNSVKLYGMDNGGSFVQTSAGTETGGTWTLSGNPTTASVGNLASNNEVTSSDFTIADILLIPQATTTLWLDITYTLGDTNPQQFTRTLDIKDLATWGQNHKITYNFTIDADVITFDDPTVEDWDANSDVNGPDIE